MLTFRQILVSLNEKFHRLRQKIELFKAPGSDSHTSLSEMLLQAVNYPFHPEATKMVISITTATQLQVNYYMLCPINSTPISFSTIYNCLLKRIDISLCH